MRRDYYSQRSDRWPVMFGDVRVVDRLVASIASLPRLGFRRMVMEHHDDAPGWHEAPGWRQHGDWLAVTLGDPHESLTARRAYALSLIHI